MKRKNSTSIANLRNFSFFAIGAVAAIALGAACVTVNVVLPESAVQRAADDYVRELYKAKERNKPTAPAIEAAPSTAKPGALRFQPISEAYADESVPLKEEGVFSLKGNPKAAAIAKKQAKLADEVTANKVAGTFGEGKDGYLVLKDASKLTGPKKVKTEKLMKEENDLRKDLYEEALGTATGSVKIETIQRSFAHSFQDFSPKGTWVEDDQGAWSKKTSDAAVDRK